MIIASFNVRNYYLRKFRKRRLRSLEELKVLKDIMYKNDIDVLCTQEITKSHKNILMPLLSDYGFYGKYRCKVLRHFPFNENNNIICNRKVIGTKTIRLPWIPRRFKDIKRGISGMCIVPRIATVVITYDDNNIPICIINTHLSNRLNGVRNRQLEAIKKLIREYMKEYPVFLTGDFNMSSTDKLFINFVNEVEEYNLVRVGINNPTCYSKNGTGKTIDHIFIPKGYKIKRSGIINTNKISDHELIYVEI